MAIAQDRLGHPCDAEQWYHQCATLDTDGRYRDHANDEAANLAPRCRASRQSPIVGEASASVGTAGGPPDGDVQVVEGSSVPTAWEQSPPPAPSPDHTLLGLGIGALAVGIGALVAAIVLEENAHGQVQKLQMLAPAMDGTTVQLAPGSAAADAYHRARTYRDAGIGLYVGAGVAGGLGLILTIVDLAQPGVLGGSAASGEGIRFSLSPSLDGGAFGRMTGRF